MTKNNFKYRIIIPVFNDNKSLNFLVNKIYKITEKSDYHFDLLIIDDHSNNSIKLNTNNYTSNNVSINILRVKQNIGHQKAIYIGLNYTINHPVDKVIIMDSDGEDDPNYLEKLINSNIEKNKNIVAKRVKRKENLLFILCYYLFKLIFRILTGKNLNFGNFSIINFSNVNQILNVDNGFHHYAASLLKIDNELIKYPIPKGERYEGKSKMNFIKLISHGLDALTVFRREAIIRIILFSVIFEFLLIAVASFIFYIRFFSNFFITGQATIVMLFIILIGFVFIFICLLLALSSTSSFTIIDSENIYKKYTDKLEKII
tara:strand:+ start:849 stop:1799 length:951 start_codon:yes stop_codon:yes gene_type:complete